MFQITNYFQAKCQISSDYQPAVKMAKAPGICHYLPFVNFQINTSDLLREN